MLSSKDFIENIIKAHNKSFNGGDDPISEIREKAIKSFETIGLPLNKSEEWKYTPVSKFLDVNLSPEKYIPISTITKNDVTKYTIPGLTANLIVLQNGCFNPVLSKLLDKELQVESLEDSLAKRPEKILSFDAKLVNRDKDPFINLSRAFLHKGVFISISPKATLQYPVHVISIENDTLEILNHISVLIEMAESSSAQVIFSSESTSQGLSNILTQVNCEANSTINLYALQHNLGNQKILNNLEAYIERNAKFDQFTITTSGLTVRNTASVFMNGEGSEAHLYGLYQTDNEMHVDSRTLMDHRVPNCNSNELYKGVLKGKSQGVFNGKIIVQKDAQRTNAFQHNANILLSEDTVMNTKPQLEIFADDVKCSHGATTGQLDEQALFYLRTRGLGEEDARALLVYAFAAEVVEKIKIPELVTHFSDLLRGRLLI